MAEFSVGQIVKSRQGKDAGQVYVVSGVEADRVKVINPPKYNTTHPKAKNPKHLQTTHGQASEIALRLEAGQDIDAGEFHRSVVS